MCNDRKNAIIAKVVKDSDEPLDDCKRTHSAVDFHQIHDEYKSSFFADLLHALNPFNKKSVVQNPPRLVSVDAMIKKNYDKQMEQG